VRGHFFEKFYQAEPLMTRKTGGAGMGLYVTKAIIEANGGQVFMQSDGPQTGSTFGFTLAPAESTVDGGAKEKEQRETVIA
jgi:signal transduction histidine kinase